LTADTYGIQAADISKAIITMQLTGQVPNGTAGQFYWATDAGAITEETSIRFPLLTDGEPHTYVLDLKSNSRWRNRITALRFDPCETKDLEVILESIELKP
jgi:hypothetical protein